MRTTPYLLLLLLARASALCALSGGQRRQLRAIAGRQEAAKTLRRLICTDVSRSAAELDLSLSSAELVRCKFPLVDNKREVLPLAEELAGLVDPPAEVAQVLGHTALFYRRSPKRLIDLQE